MSKSHKKTVRFPVPRTESRVLFSLIMAGYALLGSLAMAILFSEMRGRTFWAPPVVFVQGIFGVSLWTLVLAPLLESLLLIGIAAVVQRVTKARALVIAIPVALLCAIHGIPRCFVVAPVFLACMITYLRWRERSFGSAFVTTTLVHAWANLVPTVVWILTMASSSASGWGSTLIDGHPVAYAHCDGQVLFVLIADSEKPMHFSTFPSEEPCIVAMELIAPGREVSIVFDGEQTLSIGDQSFDVEAGRVFCLVGASNPPRVVQLDLPELEEDIPENAYFELSPILGPVVRHPSVQQVLAEDGG